MLFLREVALAVPVDALPGNGRTVAEGVDGL